MPQEWLDDRVHLLEADTCAMSLINGGDWAPARRKRRSWSVEDKRRIVEESLADGAPIAEVARRHDLNANQLFTWRRRFGVEQLEPHSHPAERLAPILPVTIMADTTTSVHGSTGQMEIVLARGDRVIVWADVETAALMRVLQVMAQS